MMKNSTQQIANQALISLSISALLALSACSDSSNLKGLVKQQLNDPSSANFKDEVFSDDGKRACLIFNAKNKMGGYGNWNVAEFKKVGGNWTIISLEGKTSNCSKVAFEALTIGEAASLKAKLDFIPLIAKHKGVSVYEEKPCQNAAYDYQLATGKTAEYTHRGDPDSAKRWGAWIEKIEKNLAAGICQSIL